MIVQDTMQYLSQLDPEVGASVQEEFARQQRNIELIASENIVSPAVMVAMGTCLTNKYAEGYPGHRYYGGCFAVDVTEELARQRACQLFGCKYANVQPHSGANANLAAFFALAQPGDTILGMNLAHGGHLSHGSPVNISGKYFHIVPYGLGEDETIDYDALLETAKACKPKIIIAGASAYQKDTFSLSHNDRVMTLDSGIHVIKCPKCDANIDVTKGVCEYCGTEIDSLQEWK